MVGEEWAPDCLHAPRFDCVKSVYLTATNDETGKVFGAPAQPARYTQRHFRAPAVGFPWYRDSACAARTLFSPAVADIETGQRACMSGADIGAGPTEPSYDDLPGEAPRAPAALPRPPAILLPPPAGQLPHPLHRCGCRLTWVTVPRLQAPPPHSAAPAATSPTYRTLTLSQHAPYCCHGSMK
jgi:hypothetical protein